MIKNIVHELRETPLKLYLNTHKHYGRSAIIAEEIAFYGEAIVRQRRGSSTTWSGSSSRAREHQERRYQLFPCLSRRGRVDWKVEKEDFEMTLSKLIQTLEDLREEYKDAEVRYASQPSWPFEYSLRQMVAISAFQEKLSETKEYLENADPEIKAKIAELNEKLANGDTATIIYLSDYLPGSVSKELG